MPQAQAIPRTEEQSDATAVPQVVETLHDRFGDPKNFINRELSWLAFNRRVLEEAHCLGKSLLSAGSFPNADAAGRGRQSSIPASVEPKPQSACTSEDTPSRRAAARHCPSAASCAAAYPHASRRRCERAVGIHLSGIANQTAHRRIV